MENYFLDLCNKINIELSKEQLSNFIKYKNLLVETNKVVNLTAIVEDKEIALKHFIDSLTINKYIRENSNIIDVGTGAGFPGIPLKIFRDDVDVLLLDSLNKRLNFLNDVIQKLDLKNISTYHARAEEAGQLDKFREKFDYVTARAVANLATLSELCLPFVKIGGTFICMKGSSLEEVNNAKNAIKILGGEIEKIDTFILPDSDIERNIIVVRKTKSTPSKYPRKAGLPSKEPIK